MFQLPEKILEEEKNFQEALNRYLNGEISDSFFRGIRVPWGFYSQRGGQLLMCRVRIPAGVIEPEKLYILGELSEKYGSGKLHITTRQDIQIHDVSYRNAGKLLSELHKSGLSSRGSGGNTIRNITACPYSGFCRKENNNACDTAIFLSRFLLELPYSIALPRKFKIAVSGCESDCAFTGVNDLGILSKKDGKYKVIIGGGMGAKSLVGKVLEESLDFKELCLSVLSAINVYNKHGDRKNRHRNRIRFLIENKGFDWYKAEYEKEKREILNNGFKYPDFHSKLETFEVKDINLNKNDDFHMFSVFPQKKDDYFYINLRIPLGEIRSEQAKKLGELNKFFPDIIFKLSQRQNLLIANVKREYLKDLYNKINQILDDFMYPETVLDILSCKGATTCNLGLGNAPGLAKNLIETIKNLNLSCTKWKNFKININGCPNACGQHPIGTLGFYGAVRKVDGRSVLFYNVVCGGKIDAEDTKLGVPCGIIPAKNVPNFIKELLKYLDKFENPLKEIEEKGKSIITPLIEKYSFVPTYLEDKEFYRDFEKEEDFSLQGLSQGECGSGIIDMIESDIAQSEASKNPIEKIYYAARALLVLKGIDVIDFDNSIRFFVKHLVHGGVFHKKYLDLTKIVEEIKQNKIKIEDAISFAEEFLKDVKEAYQDMDSSFNLPVRFEPVTDYESEKDLTLFDLRGVPCPINYVKAKLKLEDMETGDILKILLDDGEPIKNVPLSLKEDGQEIISILKKGNYFEVTVKKQK